MKLAPQALGTKTRIILGIGIALTVLAVAFDWNWFRGPLERYLSAKSSREVRIGHLDVDWSFEPTIRLRDVYVENAPWAAKKPFATAGAAAFTVSLKSLWQRRPVVSRLVLIDADVDMERLADGRRNWRLRHPEDVSPGRVRVLALEAHRTRLRFANRAAGLELDAAASPLEKPAPGGADAGFSTRIAFTGTYQGQRFSGEALNGGVVSFRESGVSFPLRGYLVSGKTRFEADGFFTDVFTPGPIDARVRIAGPSLAQLDPWLRVRPPPSRPYEFAAQLIHGDDVFRFQQLQGRIGASDVSGNAAYDRSGKRPLVIAELRSDSADLADLSPLVGMRSPGDGKPESGSGNAGPRSKSDSRKGAGARLPERPLRTERLRAFDARVTFDARRLKSAHLKMLESLRFSAHLADGVLEANKIDAGIAGGHVVGSFAFDARSEPPSSRASFELRDLRLERLVPPIAASARGAGVVRGQVKLAGQGKSIAGLLASSTGSVNARLESGRISNLADAKLGLNGGKILSLLIRGDRDIEIHCAALRFDFRNGAGTSQVITLDTAQTRTDGVGTVDLRGQRWDVLLTPQPKNPGLLTRQASIRVRGSFSDVQASIQERVAIGRASQREPEAKGPSREACAGTPARQTLALGRSRP